MTLALSGKIEKSVADGVAAIQALQSEHSIRFIEEVAAAMARVFTAGGKVIVAGNGGSLCDAMHFAEELTGFFRGKRRALPAISLSDPGHLTCVGNDIGFDYVFSRGVEAYGKRGDLFVGLTTSGNSTNLIRAFETAAKLELETVAFLGKTGGNLKGVADHELLISGFETSDRIQEAHMAAIHIAIEMTEEILFSGATSPYSSR
jgi:D-sedoheptulose 7-phosphate isomerase